MYTLGILSMRRTGGRRKVGGTRRLLRTVRPERNCLRLIVATGCSDGFSGTPTGKQSNEDSSLLGMVVFFWVAGVHLGRTKRDAEIPCR